MLPGYYDLISEVEVAHRLGSEFAVALAELPIGRWSGPVESGFGLHLVLIRERQRGSVPALAKVRDAVEREWRNVRHEEVTEEFYRGLRDQYEVSVELPEAGDREEEPNLAEVRR